MPGLAGILTFGGAKPSPEAIEGMVKLLGGTQGEVGSCTRIERLGLAVGFARLPAAILNDGVVWNSAKTVALLITGEDFSIFSPDSATLKQDGVGEPFSLQLVHRYERLGPSFFRTLNGWYSGILVDLRNDTVTIFNDRYGLNRLYYHESGDRFIVSSEAKAILALLPRRSIDQRGLAEFFSVGCVLQNRSLFQDVFLLPPASAWTFQPGRPPKKTCYFNPSEWEQQLPLGEGEYVEQLVEVFGRIAPRYHAGNDRVGMSLTGGLDSRMLLAWSRESPGTLPCYTFGGPYRDCADVSLARRLARLCAQPHTVIPIKSDFFSGFADYAEQTVRASDGAMDVSGAIEIYANRAARGIAPVRLTGNYGSEILRSNVAFRPRKLDLSVFSPEFSALIRDAEETYRQESIGHRLSFIAFKQVPWHHYARHAVERSQLMPRSPFLDADLVALAYRCPPSLSTRSEPLLKLIARGNPALAALGSDRALSLHRQPFGKVKHRWQEFTAKAEYAYDYGMPNWLVRADFAVKGLHLEKLFLGRHKFYHFRVWYRDQLADYLRDQKPGALGCYRAGAVDKMVGDHIAARSNYTLELHKMLTVNLTEKLLSDLPWAD